jgi:hypothetical protein
VQAYPNATTGKKLLAILETLRTKYGVDFAFCDPKNTGEMIVQLLGGV